MYKKICAVLLVVYFSFIFFGIPKIKSSVSKYRLMRQTVKVKVVKISEETGDYSSWQGTGVFIADNLIITAGHMVEDANKVTIIFANGKKYQADNWYQETEADLAIININTPNKECKLNFDNAKLGEAVWAYGNSLGEGWILTKGVVSAVDAYDSFMETKNMIITDCAVNVGNSGSALFDKHGNILGIYSWSYSYAKGMNYFVDAEVCILVLNKYYAIKALEVIN